MTNQMMVLRKYYDAVRTNKPFFISSLGQKNKIVLNLSRFFASVRKRPLVVNNKPVTAQIEPTSVCNLGCEFCIRDKVGVPIGTMSFENFKTILDKLDGLYKVHLSGQGEPFINPDIFKIMEYANKKGVLINTNSNGTIFTKATIDKICNVEIGEIAFSLESTKKKMFEEMRKGANFDDVTVKVKNLIEELNRRNKKTIISFAVTILRENIEEIPDFVKLAKKLGVKKIKYQTLQSKEDYVENYTDKAKSQDVSKVFDEIKTQVDKAEKIAKKNGIDIIFDEGLKSPHGCVWPWRGIYITWNGDVTPCCKTLTPKDCGLGNVLREDFWKVWNSKTYQMYRAMLRKRKAPGTCRGCNMV
jgi:radical SAM protein with 4Fe4S-binding SPASM domain